MSGRGTNLQAILEAIERGDLRAQVNVVISNHAGVPALERAERFGVPTVVIERAGYPSRRAQHQAIANCLKDHGVELVVTAGFDRILAKPVLDAFPNRIVNVHPSLLPAFGQTLHAQEAALAHGVKVTGCTVHFVNEELDNGPIILQRVVPVLEDDTVETLSARILAEEHRALPEALQLYADRRLRVEGRRVRVLAEAPVA